MLSQAPSAAPALPRSTQSSPLILKKQVFVTNDLFCIYSKPGHKIPEKISYLKILDKGDVGKQDKSRRFCKAGDSWIRIQACATKSTLQGSFDFNATEEDKAILDGGEASALMKAHEESIKKEGYIRIKAVTFSDEVFPARYCWYAQPQKIIPDVPAQVVVILLYRYEKNTEKYFCQVDDKWIRIQLNKSARPCYNPLEKRKKSDIQRVEAKCLPTPEEDAILKSDKVTALCVQRILERQQSRNEIFRKQLELIAVKVSTGVPQDSPVVPPNSFNEPKKQNGKRRAEEPIEHAQEKKGKNELLSHWSLFHVSGQPSSPVPRSPQNSGAGVDNQSNDDLGNGDFLDALFDGLGVASAEGFEPDSADARGLFPG